MRDYIICDTRKDFLNDINTALMLEAYPFRVYKALGIEDCIKQAGQKQAATIVISETCVKDIVAEQLEPFISRTIGFSTTSNGDSQLNHLGIKSIGLHKTSESLLSCLSNDPLKFVEVQTPKKTIVSAPANNAEAKPSVTPSPAAAPNQTPPAEVKTENTSEVVSEPETVTPPPVQEAAPNPALDIQKQLAAMQEMLMKQQEQIQRQQEQLLAANTRPPVEQAVNTQPSPAEAEVEDTTVDEKAVEQPAAPTKPGTKIKKSKAKKQLEEAEAEIEEDIVQENPKTSVVSVYAAKGGVGKTSISTELAVCLALTSNGRRKFRVCIVDYNIDFGDVATSLGLKDDGVNMSYWASEIRELLGREDAENIKFTRQEMEDLYLQKMKDTGLYALCAPISHEDSMLIKPAELQIMLRNIIENGEFDYVVCDTGNNTRDSSIIAIDNSDYVLLVATQDVTTANCNASVLHTLEDSGFETDKVRLIINNVMASKDTGISVQEVEETFPYPCLCRIKRTPDIIKANNLSKPLVYKPNHEYTKQIQRIIRYLTEGIVTTEPPKRGLFGLFKKKD